MPRFMLVLRSDASTNYSSFSPAEMQRIIEKFRAWSARLAEAGRLVDGRKLTDAGGRVLVPGDELVVRDGPYAETKEVIGGFYVITADDYDHAIELCTDHPNLEFGSVEIRQVDDIDGDEP